MATRLKKTPSKAIKFIESLNIPEGPLAGKKMKLAPFQRNFIANALDPETQYAFYSIGRGGAKTMLGAAMSNQIAKSLPPREPQNRRVFSGPMCER